MNRRNSEWYPDPTAYLALSAIAREEKKRGRNDFYSNSSKKSKKRQSISNNERRTNEIYNLQIR